jgi:spore coat protein CotH
LEAWVSIRRETFAWKLGISSIAISSIRISGNGIGTALLVLAAACGGADETLVTDESTRVVAPSEPSNVSAPALDATPPVAAGGAGPGVAMPSGPVGPPDAIFEREHLIEVRVEMDPADLSTLSAEGIGMSEILFPASGFRAVPEYTHFAATVSVDGVRYENVDIRKKGYIGSLSVIRPSLKLDFERRLDRELVAGNRRMTLNNDLQDPSHVKQCLSYDLFREIGVPASRCNYAHVVVNGEDLGVYSHVEAVNKPMLRRYFDDVEGNLYEGQLSDFNPATKQYLEVETNQDENDLSDVQAVIDALALPDAEVPAALGELVNLDEFFDFWALETLLGHWDGYAGNSNNYFAYHDPTSGKFNFIPWGTDQTFVGDNPNDALPYQITVYAAGTLSNRLYALPEQRARFRQRLAELNDTLWDVPSLLEQVGALHRLAPDSSREAVTRLESYIEAHGEALRTALAQPAPEWPAAPPAQPGDACQGTFGEFTATFSTRWGTLASIGDVLATGESVEGSLLLDGAPFSGPFRARAGEDGFLGNAALRLIAPVADGVVLLIELGMPVELFRPGHHPLHSFESFGLVGLADPISGQFGTLGLLGDGSIELDEASLEPGGRVTGRVNAKASYFACASSALAAAAPPSSDEGALPDEGEGGVVDAAANGDPPATTTPNEPTAPEAPPASTDGEQR